MHYLRISTGVLLDELMDEVNRFDIIDGVDRIEELEGDIKAQLEDSNVFISFPPDICSSIESTLLLTSEALSSSKLSKLSIVLLF